MEICSQVENDLLDRMEKLESKVDQLSHELTKYKGMVGGALWVISALATALTLLKEFVWTR
jgi:hypothetical protein